MNSSLRLFFGSLAFVLTAVVSFAAPSDAAEAQIAAGTKLVAPQIPSKITGATRELNARMSQDIDPAKNAVVHFVQLFGEEVFVEQVRADSLKMLGIESLDPAAPRMVYLEAFARSKAAGDVKRLKAIAEAIQIEFSQAEGKPWKTDEFPLLADYLSQNKAQLDQLVAIANLPSYYAPILSVVDPPSLMSASFALEYRLPYLAQCLGKRALNRLAEGDFPGATTDLLAIHKLANLLANGSPLDVSGAKAHWVDAYAFSAELAMLQSGLLSTEQAQTYLAALEKLPRMPTAARAADIGERFTIRQEVEMLRDYDEALGSFFDWDLAEHKQDIAKLRAAKINWDLALKRADEVQNKTVAVLSQPDRDKQMQEIIQLDEAADTWIDELEEDETTLVEAITKDREGASQWFGESIALALRTNAWQRVHTDHRGSVRRDFTIVGLALVAYRQKHGAYPDKLTDLTPEILASLPVDAHSGKPFAYQQLPEGGVRLISWGANLIPNRGDFRDDDLYLDLK
ncbi:hypothetical protein [Blastopirellula marina]|uniref:Uncharacterized protein n=1 Tax=Blastopirellula marina TaxID=124 RepID=A0A2S8G942_9BACT|nr:hypothetical protein [Blastopirellula marina]PQO40937.1 hypothetical protein C5Y98_04985 [Blastopirellula marina]PTL45819.1 hypothetical protein C5Y97_04985 [Blastopirellula marina]